MQDQGFWGTKQKNQSRKQAIKSVANRQIASTQLLPSLLFFKTHLLNYLCWIMYLPTTSILLLQTFTLLLVLSWYCAATWALHLLAWRSLLIFLWRHSGFWRCVVGMNWLATTSLLLAQDWGTGGPVCWSLADDFHLASWRLPSPPALPLSLVRVAVRAAVTASSSEETSASPSSAGIGWFTTWRITGDTLHFWSSTKRTVANYIYKEN